MEQLEDYGIIVEPLEDYGMSTIGMAMSAIDGLTSHWMPQIAVHAEEIDVLVEIWTLGKAGVE